MHLEQICSIKYPQAYAKASLCVYVARGRTFFKRNSWPFKPTFMSNGNLWKDFMNADISAANELGSTA